MVMFFILIIILVGYGVSISKELRQQTNLSKNKRILISIVLAGFGFIVYLIGSEAASFALILVAPPLTGGLLDIFILLGISAVAGLVALGVYSLITRKLIRRSNQRNAHSQIPK